MSILYLLSLFIILEFVYSVKTEIFTALVELTPLINTQNSVINTLYEYIEGEEKSSDILKIHLKNFEEEQTKAKEGTEKYLSNPINAYRLIKRLTIDLDFLEKIVGKKIFTKNESLVYPTKDDFEGAALALIRLHSTYRLNVTQLSNGILSSTSNINGDPIIETVSPLTVSDSFELAKQCYNYEHYYLSAYLLLEVLYKLDLEDVQIYNISETVIFEALLNSYSILDDEKSCAEWYGMIISPRPERYKRLINRNRERINLIYSKQCKHDDEIVRSLKKSTKGSYKTDLEHNIMFSHICREPKLIAEQQTNSLKCYYTFGPHQSLTIGPIKTEPLYRSPDIFLLHDVISDNEIQKLLDFAIPRLTPSTIEYPEDAGLQALSIRVSKYAVVSNLTQSDIDRKISNRVSTFAGLHHAKSEYLQVVNYGIGGHFLPHFDTFSNQLDLKSIRKATANFYLTDVALGGATVFTELSLRVHPVKGAALFWVNLHPSGEVDLTTRHGSCPVLAGIKWIATKWIHEIGHDFLKPPTN